MLCFNINLLIFMNSWWYFLRLSMVISLFCNLFYYQVALLLNRFYNFQIFGAHFCSFFFNLHYCHLLSSYKLLPLMQENWSWFFHLIHLSLIQLLFYFSFSQWSIWLIIWGIKSSLKIFCNVFINIICFYVYNET